MFLRFNRRFKDGKEHRYWNIVENKRCTEGKVVQRQVLYLGEINDGQFEAWYRLIEAFDVPILSRRRRTRKMTSVATATAATSVATASRW